MGAQIGVCGNQTPEFPYQMPVVPSLSIEGPTDGQVNDTTRRRRPSEPQGRHAPALIRIEARVFLREPEQNLFGFRCGASARVSTISSKKRGSRCAGGMPRTTARASIGRFTNGRRRSQTFSSKPSLCVNIHVSVFAAQRFRRSRQRRHRCRFPRPKERGSEADEDGRA